jgi:hypothetical protein
MPSVGDAEAEVLDVDKLDVSEIVVEDVLDAAADEDEVSSELDVSEIAVEDVLDTAADEDEDSSELDVSEIVVEDVLDSAADEDEDISELDVSEIAVEDVLDAAADEDVDTTVLDTVIDDEDESEEVEDTSVELVEQETVHADAVPTNITSCQPPFDQKVSIEEEVPVTVGVKVREIVMLPPAAIVAPFAGNPVAVKALPTTTGVAEVDTFWYEAP